jgi:hypothetical protein
MPGIELSALDLVKRPIASVEEEPTEVVFSP